MASVRQDNVQVKLEIEGNQAKTELDNLERKAKVLNDELRGFKKGTEEWINKSKELKDVETNIGDLRGELGMAGMTVQQLEKYTKDLYRELKTLTPGTETFIQKSQELRDVNKRLDDVRKSIKGVDEEIKPVANSLDFLKQKSRELENELGKLVPGTDAFVNKSRELRQVNERLEEIKKSIKGVEEEMEPAGNGFSDFAQKALAFTGIQMGVEAVVDGIISAGQAVAETVKEFEKLRTEINQLTGATGAELDSLTTSIAGVAKAFDKDYNEVLIASNALAKQMGISQQEAIGVIEKGFVAGADASGEFLDQLREYPPHFKQAGISADGMVAAITQFTQLGVYADKGADVIKEFGLRITEQTPAVKEALENAFGEKFTSKLLGGIEDKSITTVQALKLISEGLNDTNLTASQTQTVIADVFGGPGEDAGIEVLKGLKDMKVSMDDVLASGGIYTQQQQELVDSHQALADAQNELTKSFEGGGNMLEVLTNDTLTFLYTLLVGLVGVFSDMLAPVKEIWKNLGDLAESVGLVSKEGSSAKSWAEGFTNVLYVLAIPLQLAYKFMSWFVAGVVDLVKSSPAAMAHIRGLVASVQAIYEVLTNAPAYVAAFGAAFTEGFSKIKTMVMAALSGDWDAVKTNYSSFGADVSKAFNDAYDTEINKAKAEREKAAEEEVVQAVEIEKRKSDGITAEQKKAREKAAEEARKQAEKERQERLKNELEAAKAIEDLKNELIANEYDRKIAILQTNAAREKADAVGTAEQIATQKRLIEQQLSQEIAEVERARAAEQKKIAEETARELQDIRNRYALAKVDMGVLRAEEALKTAFAAEGVANREALVYQAQDALLRARQEQLAEEQRIEMEMLEQGFQEKLQKDIENLQLEGEEKKMYELEAFAAFLEEKQLIEEEYQLQRNELSKAHAEQRAADERAAAAEGISMMQQFTGAFYDFKKIESDREMSKLEKDKKARLKNLDDEYKAGKISKEQYEGQKSAIETNYDSKARALKRKAAEDEKQAKIADSIMAGLLAVIKAAPNVPLQVATGIMAALTTAKIIATPIPTFGKGGLWGNIKSAYRATTGAVKSIFAAKGGAINPTAGVPGVGQLHSNGGIKMIDGATGDYLGEWERGEPYMILSRDTYANNKPVIDALLDASLHKGGASIMRNGGIYAADGAVTGNVPTVSTGSGGADASYTEMIGELRAVRSAIETLPRNQRAYVVYTDIEEASEEINAVRSEAAG